MYYVVNTFTALGSRHVGTVMSTHRLEDRAKAAQAQLERAVKRANGASSYLPLTIFDSTDVEVRNGEAYHRSNA